MENKFKIKKGLLVSGSGGTLLDVQGSVGQVFSVTDSLTGDLFSVSDISGAPIFNVNSDGTVTIDGNIQLADNNKIQLGDAQDLQIYHDGSASYISEVGTGDLIISADNDLTFKDGSGNIMANMNASNSVELMYGNVKKFETTSTGAEVTGNLQITASAGDTLTLTKSTTEPSLRIEGDTDKDFVITVSGELLTFTQNDGATDILTLDHDTKNATFAGTVSAPFITASNASGAANGSPQEMARIVNIATGATSSYLYIGASSGTDWRIGKNINGTTSNTNFGITKHSGTDIFLGIDGTGNTSIHGSLTTGGGIQAGGTISSPQKIFHAAAVGANYVKIYRAEGTTSQIAGTVRISGTAHGGSHVSNFTAYVVVNHSGDILVKSFSGNYTQVSIKVESDGNEDYHLSIKSIIATSTPTYYFTIEALTDKLTLTKAPTTTPSTTATHEHTTKFGLNITGVGGDMRNGITGDLAVIGDISAQGIEVTGDITMSTASQLIFPDNSSIPDNPTNEKHDYIRFNSGSISQISGRVGLMLTSQDDSLVLANGDVGKSFVNTNINVDAEEIYMLSDNSVQLITDLQDGWDGSPSPYYTHQFVGGEHTRTNSSGGSVTFFHTGSENVMRYKGIVAGDWDTIFSQTDGHMGVYEVQNIIAGTGAGAHTNYPSGSYSFGGVMSWQLDNSTFKLYAPHTGTLWYQTGWNNDEYSGWRKIFDNSHVIPSANLDADTAHLSGNQTFSGIKTFNAGIKFGNCSMNKSGDSNHIHVTCPNALIPNSTTLANNTRLGTSAYRWKDFYAGPGNFLGSVTASADVIAYSDARLKENVKTLDGSKVLKMRGVSFDRKDTGISSSGVIAQEMQKVAPELVSDDDGTLGVAYGNLTGYLIEAIKEQQKQIDELKSQMAACNKTACNCNCKN